MSYEFEGTKAPWKASYATLDGVKIDGTWGVGKSGFSVANVTSGPTFGIDDRIQKANAQLIAAAPELFEACAEFVRKVEAGEAKSTRSYRQMKAALAKATGGEG